MSTPELRQRTDDGIAIVRLNAPESIKRTLRSDARRIVERVRLDRRRPFDQRRDPPKCRQTLLRRPQPHGDDSASGRCRRRLPVLCRPRRTGRHWSPSAAPHQPSLRARSKFPFDVDSGLTRDVVDVGVVDSKREAIEPVAPNELSSSTGGQIGDHGRDGVFAERVQDCKNRETRTGHQSNRRPRPSATTDPILSHTMCEHHWRKSPRRLGKRSRTTRNDRCPTR